MSDVPVKGVRSDVLLFIALGASLILNVIQYQKRIKNPPPSISRIELPTTGEQVPSVHLLAASGDEHQTLAFTSESLPTVIYVMSPNCKWCGLNQRAINKLAGLLAGKYRVIGLSSHLDKNAQHLGYTFPLYEADPKFAMPPITLDVTPRTLIFSPDGHFLKGWDGAYINSTQKDVEAYFNVNLSTSD